MDLDCEVHGLCKKFINKINFVTEMHLLNSFRLLVDFKKGCLAQVFINKIPEQGILETNTWFKFDKDNFNHI